MFFKPSEIPSDKTSADTNPANPNSTQLTTQHRFIRWWSTLFLALLTATIPLWVSGTWLNSSELPLSHVPLSPFFSGISLVVQNSLLFATLAALVATIGNPKWFSPLFYVIFALTIPLVLADLNRFQAWWMVFGLTGFLLTIERDWTKFRSTGGKIIVVIYLFSGISKLDYQFAMTLGPHVLNTLVQFFGMEIDKSYRTLTAAISLGMPIGEIVTAFLLCFRKTISIGSILAILMHLFLIAVLGPTGLNNQFGVLLWNVFFIGLILFCFRPSFRVNESSMEVESLSKFAYLPFSWHPIVIVCWLLGFGGIVGIVDPWQSWELYSPSSSRVELWVPKKDNTGRPVITNNDTEQHSNSIPTSLTARYEKFDIAAHTLKINRAPIYPHWRVQLPVAIGIAKELNLDRDVCIVVKGKSDRFSGKRESQAFYSIDAAERFRGFGVKQGRN